MKKKKMIKYLITTKQVVERTYVRESEEDVSMEDVQVAFEQESFDGTELDKDYDEEIVTQVVEHKGKE